jgi:hypothetical protein
MPLPSLLFLVMSAANLYAICLAVWYRKSETVPSSKPVRDICGRAALFLAANSQLLYLLFFLIWWFRWMHFYPGSPSEWYFFGCGFFFSAGGLLMAPFGTGAKRWVGGGVALTTGMMWLLSAVFSSVV